MFKALVCSAAFLLSVAGAFASTKDVPNYNYQVNIPGTALSCAAEAANLGSAFAAATGWTVNSSTCLGTITLNADQTTYPLYSILVNYSVYTNDINFAVTPYSAILGTPDNSAPFQSEGAYDTYSSCLSDIPAQVAAYETNTGIKHVAAFCEQSGDVLTVNYVLEVDGFGSPNKTLYLFKPPFMEGVNPTVFASDAQKMISSGGGTIVKTYEGAVLYYSQYSVDVNLQYLSYQDTMDHCTAQLPDANKIFSSLPGQNIVTCIQQEPGAYMTVLQLGGYILQEFDTPDTTTYVNFADCLSARALQMATYQAEGDKILGALCEISGDAIGSFKVTLYQ